MVLCFVEFVDPKCALTAMEALQGLFIHHTEYLNNVHLFILYFVFNFKNLYLSIE